MRHIQRPETYSEDKLVLFAGGGRNLTGCRTRKEAGRGTIILDLKQVRYLGKWHAVLASTASLMDIRQLLSKVPTVCGSPFLVAKPNLKSSVHSWLELAQRGAGL